MISVITGAGGGIGRAVSETLQTLGYEVIALGRAECELSSLESVAAAVERLRSLHDHIDLLINNAATAGVRGVTVDGFEMAFGVNYLSHYLLTRSLLTPGIRVVNVSSEAHRSASSLDLRNARGRTKSLKGWREYAFSKACQIAFTVELSRRRVDAISVHPGVVGSGLWRPVPQPMRWLMMRRMAPPEVGALTVVAAAVDRDLPTGSYLTPSGVVAPSAVVSDPSAAAELWNQSDKWVGNFLP